MPIDAKTPEGAAFAALAKQLFARQPRLERLYAYYSGEPPLPEGMSNLRDLAYDFFRTSRTNFAELVVEAPRERMKATGVRTSVDNDDAGDEVAWALCNAVGLSLVMSEVHQSMCALGDGYAIVNFSEARGMPVVTAEDPRQVITRHDPLTGDVIDALKIYRDTDAGLDVAYMYKPGLVLRASKKISQAGVLDSTFKVSDWDWDVENSQALPTGFENVVPVVRFRNRDGVAEFERHTDVLDRINRSILRGMVIMTYQAFKQRAIKGVPTDAKDEAGKPLNPNEFFKSGPDSLWLIPPDAEIWESGQVDLNPVIAWAKNDVLFLAAATRTPLAMFTPDAASQSAEGAKFQREGIVFRTEDRIERASVAWSQVLGLMFQFMGDAERSEVGKIKLTWAPVERFSIAERANAIAQTKGVLSRYQQLTEIWGMAPDQAERNLSELNDDLVLAAQMTALAATPAEPTDDGAVA